MYLFFYIWTFELCVCVCVCVCLMTPLCSPFSAQIGCYAAMNKKIYAMAGGSYGQLYDSVECFDPKTEQWTGLCPLKERR